MAREPDQRESRQLKQNSKDHRSWNRLGNVLGFGRKTTWGLLLLVIITAIIAGIALWSYVSRQISIALDRQREQALQSYLEQMEYLLLEKQLRLSEVDSETRVEAQTLTLTTLQELDGKRKGSLLIFLYESDLIDAGVSIIVLQDADLRDADLSGADLWVADLRGADLWQANLAGANLWGTDLEKANLRDANLVRAFLAGAILAGANLVGADLSEANLMGAYLIEANLEDAKVTDEQLSKVLSLKDATMPDGTIYDGRFDKEEDQPEP